MTERARGSGRCPPWVPAGAPTGSSLHVTVTSFPKSRAGSPHSKHGRVSMTSGSSWNSGPTLAHARPRRGRGLGGGWRGDEETTGTSSGENRRQSVSQLGLGCGGRRGDSTHQVGLCWEKVGEGAGHRAPGAAGSRGAILSRADFLWLRVESGDECEGLNTSGNFS